MSENTDIELGEDTSAAASSINDSENTNGLDCLAMDDVRQALFGQEETLWGTTDFLAKMNKIGTDEEIMGYYNTSSADGLTSDQVLKNREKFGDNKFEEKPPRPYCELLWDALQDDALKVLILAAIVSIAIGIYEEVSHPTSFPAYIDGIAILVAVILVSNVGAANDWFKDKQFRKLNDEKNNFDVPVMRNGKVEKVKVFDVVVGDIAMLNTGAKIPADGVIIQLSSPDMLLDEASMTGESDLMSKVVDRDDPKYDQILRMGTCVSQGAGKMLIMAVGPDTTFGKLMKSLDKPVEATPLQEKLDDMVNLIGRVGFAAAIGVIVAYNAVCFSGTLDRATCGHSDANIVLSAFIAGIVIVVVAIPEGLPLAVTIALAYSSHVMVKENVLVRVLAACETMGGATNICSDKTGTLTTNQMSVTRGYIADDYYEELPAFNDNYDKGGVGGANPACEKRQFNDEVLDLLNEGLTVNAAATIQYKMQGKGNAERLFLVGTGSASEVAMIAMMHQYGYKYLRENPDINEYGFDNTVDYESYTRQMRNKIEELSSAEGEGKQSVTFPFSSELKRSSVVFKKASGKFRCHTKGASEQVLALCTNYIDKDNNSKPIDDAKRAQFDQNVLDMANSGLRTFTVAFADLDSLDAWDNNNPSACLTMIAILGIKDPVRDEVPNAVATCKGAGITVRMVTGDKKETAAHIANECGIYDPSDPDNSIIMTGADFRQNFTRYEFTGDEAKKRRDENLPLYEFRYDQQAVHEWLPKLHVLARSSPEDKEMMVSALKDMGNVVGATGDGTNDAPALKAANVGLAMGITGTELAKEASDIILLDDRFQSIVEAVKWGRNIFLNIRKFLQFQLTVNVVALVVAFIAACFGKMPLTPIQLLWVNLIMDTFAALALATEPPNAEQLLSTPPYNKEALVTPTMWRHIFCQSGYQLIMIFTLFFNPSMYNVPQLTNNTAEQCLLNTNMPPIAPPPAEPCQLSDATVLDCMVFNSFVLMQVFNEINARSIDGDMNVFRGFFQSKMFVAVIIGTLITQVILVEVIGRAGPVFKTVPLTGDQWLICFLMGLGSLPVGVLMRVPSMLIAKNAVSKPKAGDAKKITESNSVGPLPPGKNATEESDKGDAENAEMGEV